MAESLDFRSPVDLTVLLPAWNEEPAIGPLIDEIRTVLGDWWGDWELLVVDDASTDRTAEVAEEKNARVIRRVENGGSGAARIAGILAARGRAIAMLDADGSYDPGSLPELLSHLPAYDQVNGARTSEQGTHRWLRTPAKWLIRKLAELVSGRRIPDLNTGLKVFKRDVMLRYLWAVPDGFSCVSSMTLAFLCNGQAVKFVPVRYRPRVGCSKFHPVRDTARYLLTVLRIITYFQPLRVFLPAAALLGAVATVRGSYHLVVSELGLTDSDVVLAVASLMVFVAGLLADLIVKQRRFLWMVTQSRSGLPADTAEALAPSNSVGERP
jgi:polyisoprenyl-phosphate glycosyltransferase